MYRTFPSPVFVSDADDTTLYNYNPVDLDLDYYLSTKESSVDQAFHETAATILRESTALCKKREVEWLANQILDFKGIGRDVPLRLKINDVNAKYPIDIGAICARLYARGSFWYQSVNRVRREGQRVIYKRHHSSCIVIFWIYI